jgi:hypothetical protein
MMNMLEWLGAITCMKQYFFIFLAFSKLPFKQVDSVMAHNRRQVLNEIEDLILSRKVINISLILSVRRRRPNFSSDCSSDGGHEK